MLDFLPVWITLAASLISRRLIGVDSQNSTLLECPTDWVLYGTQCYRIYDFKQTWGGALRICKTYGSHLVKIRDVYTNNDLSKLALDKGISSFWIGLHVQEEDGNVSSQWSDGETVPVYYGFWMDSQPQFDTGQCVYSAIVNTSPKWSFGTCEWKRNFVCEMQACPQGTFRCSNGMCVNSVYKCDGVEDCSDGSDELDCSSLCRYHLKSPSGDIASPNYPNPYNSLDDCSWLIETDLGTYVQIRFPSVSTEENTDEVMVFGGGSTLATASLISRFSGNVVNKEILSPNNFLLVKFSSNFNVQLQGFQATWTTVKSDVPSGGRRISVTVIPGTVTSPVYPSLYLPNQETLWILSTSKSRAIITLQFNEFDLAPGDSLLLRAGDSADAPLLKNLNSSSPREKYILSTKNSIYLLLRTGMVNIHAYRGFSLSYYEGCRMVLDETHGYISSPGYDVVSYPNYMTCYWSLSVPGRKRITLIFEPDFDVDSPGDYIQIFDGENESGTPFHGQNLDGYTGTTAPTPKSTPGGRLFVKFTTNSIINKKGFAARYSQGCSAPKFNDNTKVREQIAAHDFGLVMTVYCDVGYSFNSEDFYERQSDGTLVSKSSVKMECLYGGVWSVPRIPQCVRKTCGPPPTVANGFVLTTTGTLFGDTATYICVGGAIQGGATITCNSDSTWTTPPTCSTSDGSCPLLTTPGHARRVDIEGTYPSAGSVVQFECDQGYEIRGQPILLCGMTGQWNGDTPVCQALTCRVPVIQHGSIKSPDQFVTITTSLTVTCDTGFSLQGSNSIQCQPNREFGVLPTCIDVDECVNDQTLCSSGEMCVNTEGSFSCVCRPGFERQGSECVDIPECSTNSGGCDSFNGACVEEQGGYTCTCNTGYTLYIQNGTMKYFIPPGETGLHPSDVYYIGHTCVKNQCPTPSTLPNRIILTPQRFYHYGDTVRFQCHPGHDMLGSAELICEASGKWNKGYPICTLKTCPFDDVSGITNPARFSTARPVLYGQNLFMVCNVGGKEEQRLRTCQYDHVSGGYRLLGDNYNCQLEAQTCRNPKLAHHAKGTNSGTSAGSSFPFLCEPHYIYKPMGTSSDNSSTVMCGADGKWDYGDLRCVAMTCPYPGIPAGGEVVSFTGNYMYNSQVTFRCRRPGFKLDKPYALMCVHFEFGGAVSWNDTLPSCIDAEPPTFLPCPESEVRVKLYESAGFTVPKAVDNSGSVSSVSVTPPYFHPSWPVSQDLLVTYTATDHAGNTGTCEVTIRVVDEEPPTIQCLGSRYITVDDTVTTVTFSNGDVRAKDNLGVPVVRFQPSSVSASLRNVGENYTITATATDSQGNTERCFFQVVIVAKICHPDYLPVPMNGAKSCRAVGSGFRCSFVCNPGFYFYDEYPLNTFVSQCKAGQQWSNSNILSCGAPGPKGRELQLSVVYSGLTSQPSSVCEQSYVTNVQNQLLTLQGSLTAQCNVSSVTEVGASSASVTSVYDGVTNQLRINIKIPLLPYGLSLSEYTTCSNRIITDFQQLRQQSSAFSPLSTVVQSGCPSLQGTAGPTNTGSVCEGRGELKVINGQEICKVCRPGSSYNSTGQCQLCPVGTYQSLSGQITCVPCPQETRTDGIGKTSLADCLRECPGSLVSDTGLPPCRQCPRNQYKINSTHCTECAPETMYVGSDNPLLSDCKESACMYIQRKNQQMVGGTDIMDAVVGIDHCQASCNQFRRRFESRQCIGFNFFKGIGICLLYDVIDSYQGTLMYDFYERICPKVTKADCFCANKCPAGMFSYNGYEPNCRSCPIGYFSASSGSTRCQECPPGQTTALVESTQCVPASSVLCLPGPCVNGGTCRLVGHSEECDCAPGFTGRYCNTEIDFCASQPCYNGGTCQVSGTTYICSCIQGYTGSRCETNIDDCRVGQCGESGVCIDGVGTSQCHCVDGHSGSSCEVLDVGACERYPCKNGGTCIPTNDFWRTCNCIPPYTGEDCDRQAVSTECAASPCQNGGTCTEVQGSASCSCLSGFSGTYCQIRNQTCATRDCGYLAGCVDDPVTGLSWCVCRSGYTLSPGELWTQWYNTDNPSDGSDIELRTAIQDHVDAVCFDSEPVQAECRIKGETTLVTGPDCTVNGISCRSTSTSCPDYEVRFRCSDIVAYKASKCVLVDHCSNQNPCQNKGVCENIQGGYRCQCTPDFTGSNCQHSINSCASQPCLNEGTCTEGVNGFQCQCATGFDGTRCENNPDDCLLGFCDPVGTARCSDGNADYTCVCWPGYTDKNCSTNINECASAPCQQSGRCSDGINNYTCSCPSGWTGKNCDVVLNQCSVSNPCDSNTVCQTLFNDVYCSCQGVSSGGSCQTLPTICQTANPCVPPATCISNSTTTSCVCPIGRTGANCELLASTECFSTVCENGGTCTRSGNGEIKCECVRGYEGSRCENPADNCKGVNCPASAACTDGLNEYFCRCPVGKLPPSCAEDINTNYDLCFLDSETPGSAALPYSIPVSYTNGFSITLWVRFSTFNGRGTFFSVYQDLSEGSVTSTRPILYLSEQGLYSYLDNRQILLPFLTTGQLVNDGNWHSVIVIWHTTTGSLHLIMDGVSQIRQEDFQPGLPLPSRIWVSLGSHPVPPLSATSPTIISSSSFPGCVSQVNIYGRQLNFNAETDVLNTQPQFVFDTSSMLMWSEYVPEGSALVTRPSTAGLNTCAPGFTNPPSCITPRRVSSPVRVLFCPENQFLAAPTGSVQVSWQIPQFEGADSITSNYSPGIVLTTGKHSVMYEGRDTDGNVVLCTFFIFINNEMCAAQADPRGGGSNSCQTKTGSWPVTACSPTCPNPNSGLVQSGPVYYTCGPGGDWSSLDQTDGLYPACGQLMGPARVDVKLKLRYRLTSMTCEEQQNLLETRIRQSIVRLNLQWGGALCASRTCSEVTPVVNCNRFPITDVEVTIPNIRSVLNTPLTSFTPKQIFTRAGLDNNIFTFTREGAVPNENTFDVSSTDRCPPGQVAIQGMCFTCGPGTYHNNATNTCDNCPIGQYTAQYGAVHCEACPQGETTPRLGNTDQSTCSSICRLGEYFNISSQSCMPCDLGTYQNQTGAFSCKQCPLGQVTTDTGAVSLQQCKDGCDSGQQFSSDGQCILCPVGTYRVAQVDPVCQKCPDGFTTSTTGSTTPAQCTIVACPVGQFRDVSNNTCQLCPLGSYQDTPLQTTCTSCGGERYRTDTPGATSSSQCRFYCPSGSEAINGNTDCQQCPVGQYKDNTVDFYGSCLPCPGNGVTRSTGTTSVLDCISDGCASGQQFSSDGQCTLCPVGTYRVAQVDPVCQKCPDGFTTSTTGSTSPAQCTIVACPVGQFREVSNNTCQLCPLGSYQDTPLQTTCTSCGGERYRTDTPGATSSSQCRFYCPSGSEAINGNTDCQQCPVGQYKDNTEDFYGSCLPCPGNGVTRSTGTTSVLDCISEVCPSGQELVEEGNCSLCPRGTYKDNAEGLSMKCKSCPVEFITATTGAVSRSLCTVRNCSAGYRLNETDNSCVECGIGFFQSRAWQTQCEQCPPGTVTTGTTSISSTDCRLICTAGFEDRNGVCQRCNTGFYKSQQDASLCQPCSDDRFRTSGEGATSELECNIAACVPGSSLNTSTNECELCPLSKYQPVKWQDSCILCPPGLVTYSQGAISRDQCLLECESGKEYNPSSERCEECRLGYYRDAADRQDRCQICPIDKITPGNGATSIAECTVANCTVPGQFLNTSSNQCVDCPAGTFQDQWWAVGCQKCPEGFTTRSTGTTSTVNCYRDCPSGSQVIESNNTCQQCPAGQYRTNGNSWSCILCDLGFTTPGVGSTSAADCRIPICGAGTAYNQGTNKCQPCPLGTYQTRLNQQRCDPCPGNQTTRRTGAISDRECYSFCSTERDNCTGTTECVDQPYGFSCQCIQGYVGSPDNCTHVCDLPSYCTNQGVCRKEVFPSCLCPEFYLGETCELRIAPTRNINNTIIGTVIGVTVFLLLLALILVGIYTRRRRGSDPDESLEETMTDGVSMSPSSYMTLRTTTAPYSILALPLDIQPDPAFYSAKQQSEVDRSYIHYDNDIVRL